MKLLHHFEQYLLLVVKCLLLVVLFVLFDLQLKQMPLIKLQMSQMIVLLVAKLKLLAVKSVLFGLLSVLKHLHLVPSGLLIVLKHLRPELFDSLIEH